MLALTFSKLQCFAALGFAVFSGWVLFQLGVIYERENFSRYRIQRDQSDRLKGRY